MKFFPSCWFKESRFISFFRIQGRSRSTTSKWEKIDLSCAVSITICKIWRKDVNLEWETFFVMLSNSKSLGTLQQILTKIWYGKVNLLERAQHIIIKQKIFFCIIQLVQYGAPKCSGPLQNNVQFWDQKYLIVH